MFWKYAANLQVSNQIKCDFNKDALASLFKSHFSMGVFLKICCMFSEYLFLRTSLDGCFWSSLVVDIVAFKLQSKMFNFLHNSLHEKCPNTEFFLVRIFPHFDWIRRDTPVWIRENTDQKKLLIWALFTQWLSHYNVLLWIIKITK